MLLSGQSVSVFGDRMVTVALAFAVLEVGGSALGTALWLAFALFLAAVLALIAVPDVRRLPADPAPTGSAVSDVRAP